MLGPDCRVDGVIRVYLRRVPSGRPRPDQETTTLSTEPLQPQPSAAESAIARARQTVSQSTLREVLGMASRPGVISFAVGLPGTALFPVDALSLAIVGAPQQAQLTANGLWKVPASQSATTNLEAFRYWAQDYLELHAAVHSGQPCAVKIGDPSGRGIPVEMMFYSRIVDFPAWEMLRSQLYCHYLATLPAFGLRVFQEPVGSVSEQRT